MTGTRLTIQVAPLADEGVRAIVEALRLDRAHVDHVAFDPACGALTVDVARADAAERVREFVDRMRRAHRLIARRVLRANRAARMVDGFSDDVLASSPDIQRFGDGLTGLRGDLLRLFRFFERRFAALAELNGAEDNHYPVMMPNALLDEMGYFGHFPQHATFCCHFPDDLPLLESVAEAAKATRDPAALDEAFAGRLARPGHVLTPGVCLPCYSQQRDLVLGAGEVRALTMQNHVFRYEAGNFRPLARAWDFSVRDVVFFGRNRDLVERRAAAMDCAFDLCEELDLDVTIELANDPFFLDASRDKAVYQRMGEVKYELLFHLPHRDEPLAVSSFNLHRDFYTSLYNIRCSDGAPAESACMGFGLERWLYGFVSQKGLNPAHWPSCVLDGPR